MRRRMARPRRVRGRAAIPSTAIRGSSCSPHRPRAPGHPPDLADPDVPAAGHGVTRVRHRHEPPLRHLHDRRHLALHLSGADPSGRRARPLPEDLAGNELLRRRVRAHELADGVPGRGDLVCRRPLASAHEERCRDVFRRLHRRARVPRAAALLEYRDRLGNQLTLERDSNRNLTRVASPDGRSIDSLMTRPTGSSRPATTAAAMELVKEMYSTRIAPATICSSAALVTTS